MGALLCFTGGGYGVRMVASFGRQSKALRAVIAAAVVMVSKAVVGLLGQDGAVQANDRCRLGEGPDDVGAAAAFVSARFAGRQARSAATARAGTPRTPAAPRGHRPDVLPSGSLASTASNTRPYWGRGPGRRRICRRWSGRGWPSPPAPTWASCPAGCAGSGVRHCCPAALSQRISAMASRHDNYLARVCHLRGCGPTPSREKGAAARAVRATDGTPAPTGRVLLRDRVWPVAIGTRLRRAARPPRWRRPFMFCGGRGCGGVVGAGPRRWVG
jgi:hypothetical protein